MKLKLTKIDIAGRRVQIGIAVCAGVVLILALIIFVLFAVARVTETEHKEDALIKIGESSLTKAQYEKFVTEAKSRQVSEEAAKAIATDYVRAQEIARQLNLEIPGYFIAAQQPINQYQPYADLSDYDRARLFPRALQVLVRLAGEGGSLNTVLSMAYDDKDEDKANDRVLVEGYVASGLKSADTSKDTSGDPLHRHVILSFIDYDNEPSDSNNVTQIVALTNDGRVLHFVGEDGLGLIESSVADQDFSSEIFSTSKETKEGKYSSTRQLSNKNIIYAVYKGKSYSPKGDIVGKYSSLTQTLDGRAN